ncbi:MAG: NupC/NupG family nucleoside CNT transporter [Microcystaceae cyanobacterium]
MERIISLLGYVVFIALIYGFSQHKTAIRWRTLALGIILQFSLGIFILKTPFGLSLFQILGNGVTAFLNYADEGSKFVFGENYAQFFIAFKVLPTIVFFSSFITILYHYGILQRIVKGLAWVMQRSLRTTAPETLSCAANIFVGQTEAPLLIKPYVQKLTKSELHAVMTGGFATIAGGVMAAYIALGIQAEYLIAASVMAAPMSLGLGKLLVPETESSHFESNVEIEMKSPYTNVIEAATIGAKEGGLLALNVAAMIIAFLGLLALINGVFGYVGGLFGFPTLSLTLVLSYLFFPVAWLMGIPWLDCGLVGELLGKKLIINEFIAYIDLREMIEQDLISQRTEILTTFALCGFANLGSLGIQIGGIGAIAPNRTRDLSQMGIKALICGFLVSLMNACVAGILT